MNYLEWLIKTPNVQELPGIEEYLKKEKEETVRVMKKRLRKGKESSKQKSEDLLGKANKLYVKGELEESIEKIKEALSYNSTSDGAYYLLGVIYEEQQEKQKAFNAFLIAASIKRDDIVLWEKLYEIKKKEKDIEFQIYILKKLKKIKPSQEVLEELLSLYIKNKRKEKAFEAEAELIPYTGFKQHFIKELIESLQEIKNRKRIIDSIHKELVKEKKILLADDEFIIGYIDILFIDEKYKYVEQVNNSLLYVSRTVECIRTKMILLFFSLISEVTDGCFICRKNESICKCKENLLVDESMNILLVNGEETKIINQYIDIPLLSNKFHLGLLRHFMDIFLNMRKYSFVLHVLLLVDAHADKEKIEMDTHAEGEEDSQALYEIEKMIVKERIEIKKRIAISYEKKKELNNAIIQYKGILRFSDELMAPVKEEIKMKISQVYEKLGNVDLALEYALQISSEDHLKEKKIIRDNYSFYRATECKWIRSLLYKSTHIIQLEKKNLVETKESSSLSSTYELIKIFLKNSFLFGVIKKKRNFSDEKKESDQLIGTKEFEQDFPLLQEITGLGEIFYGTNTQSNSKKIYFDVISSLLGGLTPQEWISIVETYVSSLFLSKSYAIALLLLKKAISSSVLRRYKKEYSSLLWFFIKISVSSQDLASLSYGVNQMILFYSHRSDIDPSTFFYLGYFLSSKIPQFYNRKEFYMLQKNFQRNLQRKIVNPSFSNAHTLNLLIFSYLPSFIYTDTVEKIEENIKRTEVDRSSLLGISSTISLSSLFLTHASSRKVKDRNKYIKKGISLLKNLLDDLLKLSPKKQREYSISFSENTLIYIFPKLESSLLYKENENPQIFLSEKVALLSYNLARAYHQYKLFGAAEMHYLNSISYTTNQQVESLACSNLFLLGKRVSIQ
ncbi:hypothetical protein NEFER03_1661 [Nematocida sp. LUAm3]|nr:hypothetical protein NEFER03_1661 [Nematocida sp. LUAm3]KAI5174685.1 hypothetical protein NEFER02_0795 [Nematocida sp. LUAm2]KAI5177904.1 hypothetical protein NEFER01_1106 [Nematocida sp. LUAm1]